MRHLITILLVAMLSACGDAGLASESTPKNDARALDLLTYTIGKKAIDQPTEMALALEGYLLGKAYDRSSLESVVHIGSSVCEELGRTRVAQFGEVTRFLEDCAKVASETEYRWMPVSVSISGMIDSTTLDALKYLYAAIARGDFGAPTEWTFVNDTYQLYLASEGGDPEVALSAGEYIWRMFDNVYATEPGCFSACIFLLAAGQDRAVFAFDPWDGNSDRGIEDFSADSSGIVGVHSPIPLVASSVTQSDLVEIRARIAMKSREHFQRYGVKESLVDLMMATPSGEIRLLSERELSDYALVGESVVKTDIERVDMLAKCGAKFEARLAEFDATVLKRCPQNQFDDFDGYMDCWDALAIEMDVSTRTCGEYGVVLQSDFEDH